MRATDTTDAGCPVDRLEAACEGLIEAAWLSALVLVPLLVNLGGAHPFDPPKGAALRLLAVVMAGAWLTKVAGGGRAWRPLVCTAADQRPWRALAAAVLLLALVRTASALLSVDPGLGWWGSLHRAEGMRSDLALLVVALLVLAHLRDASQWRRLVATASAASLAVAAYAVVQAAGLDPIPWVGFAGRAFATLGNPIFLASYLALSWFLTVAGLAEGGGARRWWLAGVAAAQVAALVLSGSRGPLLGWLAGLAALAAVAVVRWPRWALARPRLAAATAVLAVVAAALGARGEASARLVVLAGPAADTAAVRLEVWQVAARAWADATFPVTADGRDPRAALRPWLGFGPETFVRLFHATSRGAFVAPEQANAAADRAHNTCLELLVERGVLGVAAASAVLVAVIVIGLVGLGVVATTADRRLVWVLAGGLAAAAALVAWLLDGGRWLGLAAPAGLLLGAILAVAIVVCRRPGRAPETASPSPAEWRTACLLALVVAHMVEVQHAPAARASRLLFWLAAATLATTLGDDPPGRQVATGPARTALATLTALPVVLLVVADPSAAAPTTVLAAVTPVVVVATAFLLALGALAAALASGQAEERAGWGRVGSMLLTVPLALGALVLTAQADLGPVAGDILAAAAARPASPLTDDDRLALLAAAARIDPHRGTSWLALGRAAREAAATTTSTAELRRLLERASAAVAHAATLAPADWEVALEGGRVAALAARVATTRERQHALLDQAAERYRRARQLRPASLLALDELAQVEVARGAWIEAEEAAAAAVATDPARPDGWWRLAAVAAAAAVSGPVATDAGAQGRRLDQALAAAERCLAVAPEHEAALRLRARLLSRRDRVDEAIAAHRELLARFPPDAATQLGLALLLRDAGQAAEAATAARAGLRLVSATTGGQTAQALAAIAASSAD